MQGCRTCGRSQHRCNDKDRSRGMACKDYETGEDQIEEDAGSESSGGKLQIRLRKKICDWLENEGPQRLKRKLITDARRSQRELRSVWCSAA